eukprot:scaffold25694_cov127-Cylindrotheca_fusiformis.AAC.13
MTVIFCLFALLASFLVSGVHDALAFQKPSFRALRDFRQMEKLSTSPSDDGLLDLENRVRALAQERLDLKRVSEALEVKPRIDEYSPSSTLSSRWQIALSSAIVSSAVVFATTQSKAASGSVFVAIFFMANRDPIEEEGAVGASARLLGRFAIKSVEVAKPKLKAVARAAITNEEEIYALRQEINSLRDENRNLRLWKARILAVDERLADYTLDELKGIARENAIPVGGSKRALMMRLFEAELIEQ